MPTKRYTVKWKKKAKKRVNNRPASKLPMSRLPRVNSYKSKFTKIITLDLYNLQSPNGLVWYIPQINASNDPKFASWKAVFGQYKICGCSFEMVNEFNTVTNLGSTGGNITYNQIEGAALQGIQGITPPLTWEKTLNYRRKRRFQLYSRKPFKIYQSAWVQRVLQTAAGSTQYTVPERSTWTSTQQETIPHYTVNLMLHNAKGGTTAWLDGDSVRVYQTTYITYRNERDS